MRGQLIGQQALDLFPEERRVRFDVASVEHVTRWLIEARGCTDAVGPYVEGLYEEFGYMDAFERCKALTALDGRCKADGWELQDAAEYLGIHRHDLDYHTVWDRAHAARAGLAKADVPKVEAWDYAKGEPIYAR